MSNISPFTVVALNSRIVRRVVGPSPLRLPPVPPSPPCESDEIQHVKKTSHVEGGHGAEPEFGVTVAPRVVVDGWACEQ